MVPVSETATVAAPATVNGDRKVTGNSVGSSGKRNRGGSGHGHAVCRSTGIDTHIIRIFSSCCADSKHEHEYTRILSWYLKVWMFRCMRHAAKFKLFFFLLLLTVRLKPERVTVTLTVT